MTVKGGKNAYRKSNITKSLEIAAEISLEKPTR